MRERKLFIDGRWTPARAGARLEINDPATGERVGSTALAEAADIDDAAQRRPPRPARLGRHPPRRPRANPASGRRPDSRRARPPSPTC